MPVYKWICSSYMDPCGLTAFVACRLIALNKCPGVRPIGIGEVVRRILGKAVLATIGDDIRLQGHCRFVLGSKRAVSPCDENDTRGSQ